MSNRLEILWKGDRVGFIVDPKTDMFEVYGEWLAEETNFTREFIKVIENGDEVVVRVGKEDPELLGYVEIPPEDEICIKSYPGLYS